MKTPLISIIMPAYNAERYIQEAIESVLQQNYNHWELLIVNDGSTDGTERIIQSFNDSRISYFQQKNKGVSAARNTALENMKGDFFCFLDADDRFTTNSLSSRLQVFLADSTIDFVDGCIAIKTNDLKQTIDTFLPTYKGNPLEKLLLISRDCFFGITWMIKRHANKVYKFEVNIRHAEDLLFFISIAKGGFYSFTNEVILDYRSSTDSAMSNAVGLEFGYLQLIQHIKQKQLATKAQLHKLKKRVALILFKTYLNKAKPIKAIRAYLKFMAI